MKSLSIFRSAFNTVGKRYSMLTITTLIMAAGVFIYYFYFLTSRADTLDQRQYRILNRIENQLQLNLEGYKNLAAGQTEAAIVEVVAEAEKEQTLDEIQKQGIGRLNILLNDQLDKVSFLKRAKADSGNVKLKSAFIPEETVTDLEKSVVHSFHDTLADSLLTISVKTPVPLRKLGTFAAQLEFRISFGSLIRPLLRYDMFDQFVVLHDEQIVYETQASGKTTFNPDTTQHADEAVIAPGRVVQHVVINGIEYRAYRVGFSTESETGWAIVGLISADKFAAEKRTIPRPYLFAVFISVIFIILSVPFIKSLIMSRTERLGSTDVIFTAVSLAITTSVISVLLLDGYLRIDLDSAEQEEQLTTLSETVEKNLLTEADAVVDELEAYIPYAQRRDSLNLALQSERNRFMMDSADGKKNSDEKKRADQNIEGKTENDTASIVKSGSTQKPMEDPIVKLQHQFNRYPDFNNLFVVDSSGKTRHDFREPNLSFNVSSRKYVRNILANKCMRLDGLESPFYLDAIISWREQQFRGVISIPVDSCITKNYKAAVMTMRLKSLSDPLLPAGSGFCLFDSGGNVFFHSDSTRALNENFLEECENHATLNGCITGRTSAYIDVEYSGTPHKVFVRPIGNLPYFLATFSHRAPVDAIHGQIFGMAFVLQILLFAFYIAVILFGMILMRRRSRLRLSLLELSAFAPDVNGLPRYVGGFLFNVLHALLIISVACLLNESMAVILLFFICAPYTILLNMVQLSGNTLFSFIAGNKRKLFLLYGLCIIIANILAAWFIDAIWVLPLVQLAIVGIFLVVENRSRLRYVHGLFAFIEKRNTYKTAYVRLIFVLVVLTCVMPAIAFSIVTFNKEKEIQVKTVQLQVMNRLTARGSEKLTGMNELSSYFNPFYSTQVAPLMDSCSPVSHSDLLYDGFTGKMRRLIQNSGEQYNRLKFGASDGLWSWCYHGNSGDRLLMTAEDPFQRATEPGFQLISKVPFFEAPFFDEGETGRTFRFWPLLFLAIGALYYALRFFVGKVFVDEKYSRTRSLRFDQAFFENMTPGYKAFITGMPSAGKSAYFRELCKGKNNIHSIDFVSTPTDSWKSQLDIILKSENGVVVLDHFEHDLLDETKTTTKLDVIEQLIAARNKRVVIISSVQPAVFLNMLESGISDENKSARAHERWNRVLASFYDFIFPLQGYQATTYSISAAYKSQLAPGEELAIPDRLVRLVESECDNGMFMRTIGMELMDELHKRREVYVSMSVEDEWKEREDIIIRVQKLAENYYRSIWNHLAVEEQFVLFDLAQDGLVNPKNLDIVEELIDKGIIIYNSKLRLMNRSFRNFILCVAGPADLERLEHEVRHSGTWSKLKVPLFLVVGALLLFVVKSDRSQLFGYFTAITALIPVVVGVISLFGQSAKKE